MDKEVNYNGLTLGGAFFLVLFVLKILGKISLSWVWVTAPLWIPIAIGLLFLIIWGILKIIQELM